MKQIRIIGECITEKYNNWRKDALNYKIMYDFLDANGILFEDLYLSEGKIRIGLYEIDLVKVVLRKKNCITNKLYRFINIESGLDNICNFFINYYDISKPVTYENIIYSMGLNLASFTDIEDKKGLKIQVYLRKKHFKQMKQLNIVKNIKKEIGEIAKRYGNFEKYILNNIKYSEFTKYEFGDYKIAISVQEDYLSVEVLRNGIWEYYESFPRIEVINDEDVYNLIIRGVEQTLFNNVEEDKHTR